MSNSTNTMNPTKKTLFDRVKNKQVVDNRQNRARLVKQNDLPQPCIPRSSITTVRERLNRHLQLLKNDQLVHISFRDIRAAYEDNCFQRFGAHVVTMFKNKKIMMRIGNRFVPFNIENIRNINRWFQPFEEQDNFESDVEFKMHVARTPFISLSMIQDNHGNKLHEGAFFKYFNNTKLDLSRYQVYKNDKETTNDKKSVYEKNCLLYALEMGGLDEERLEYAKTFVHQAHVTKKSLSELCLKLEITITLEEECTQKCEKHGVRSRKITIGKVGAQIRPVSLLYIYNSVKKSTMNNHFEIGLLDDHFFLNDQVPCTLYAIENYAQVCRHKDWNQIYKFDNTKKCYKRNASRYTTSFKLLQTMLRQTKKHSYTNIVDTICDKHQISFAFNHILEYITPTPPLLRPIRYDNSNILSTPYYKHVDKTIEKLKYSKKNCTKTIEYVQTQDEGEDEPHEVLVFDFETCPNGKHVPYIVCCYNSRRQDTYYGIDCGLQLLQSIDCNTILLAHNATYDYRFLVRYLEKNQELARGNNLIVSKSVFNGHSIIIKDSFKLIPSALRTFPKIFNLQNMEKEVMPYTIYTEENVAERHIDISLALQHLEDHEYDTFLNNITKWNVQKENKFDMIEYSKRYCEIDCKVLHNGYFVFRGWILEQLGLDVNHILTAASLADTYLKKTGCYEDVYQLSGVPQVFIQKCIVGGRVMPANNKKHIIREEENQIINDFDAVSLYPSAMYRMPGFLKGTPKVITTLTYDFLQQCDGYFVEIEIEKVGIKRSFPLISFKTEKGIRMFTNECIGQHIFVDKITLEDLIEFQKVEFKIIRGYYFDEGYNNTVNQVINFMFQQRLRLKSEKNPAEMVYKLMMNSSYGKTIMKPVEHDTHMFTTKKDYDKFMSRNYNQIYQSVQFGSERYKVWTYKSILNHFNSVHVGCMILSFSKRIMNEVMCLGEDHNLKIYYQDTDSMHISDQDISILSNQYKIKYNRDLIGKSMGQFHSDFSLASCHDVVSIACVFNGKKCYIDKLRGLNKNNEIEYGYHIRMKGVSTDVVIHEASKQNISPFDLFEKLYNGESIEFNMLDNGSKRGKCSFMFNKEYEITSRSTFKRSLKF